MQKYSKVISVFLKLNEKYEEFGILINKLVQFFDKYYLDLLFYKSCKFYKKKIEKVERK